MKKLVLLMLLAVNALMQLGGATLMTFFPAKAARDIFKVSVTPETQQLLGVIGGATYGCLLLGSVAMLWTARGRRSGFDLAALFGGMLALIGVVMLATGTRAGAIDIAKGVVIGAVALWAGSSTREPLTA